MSAAASSKEMTTYLTTLIAEKGRDIEADLKIDGHIGLSYQNLVEFIAGTSPEMQAKIRKTLVMIDFKAGDVFDYLDFLVKGMLESVGF